MAVIFAQLFAEELRKYLFYPANLDGYAQNMIGYAVDFNWYSDRAEQVLLNFEAQRNSDGIQVTDYEHILDLSEKYILNE
jgi:hypothetical protein